MQNLQGLHVLVTRPEPEGKQLCTLIQEAGGQALHFPTLAFQPINTVANQKIIHQLNHYQWIIFTSPRAVEYGLPLIQAHWRFWPPTLKIASIGCATAKALEMQNLKVQACPTQDWNSEGLLALPEFKSVHLNKILIVKGVGGRELLYSCLNKRGAKVDIVNVYQRVMPSITIKEPCLAHMNVIVCTSIAGMQNLVELIGKGDWQNTAQLVVISQRMLESALSLGFLHQPKIAENASHGAVMDVLNNILKAK